MATETKAYVYQIIVDTQAGTASINGTAIALDKLESKFRKISVEAQNLGKNMGQTASKTGLAGAAVVEIGRTISDSNYGIMAMANNLQQLTTLFVTLIATTGSLKNAINELKKAFMGPLGIIVGVQIFIAMIEKSDMAQRNAAKSAEKYGDVQKKKAAEILDALKDTQSYIGKKAKLVGQEIALEEALLERSEDWRAIAKMKQDIIQSNIDILLQEREQVQGLDISKFEEYTTKIRELRAESERVLREEFGGRPGVEGGDEIDTFGVASIPTNTNDLGTSALAGLNEFYNSKAVMDAAATHKEWEEAQARKKIIWSEAQQRNEALGFMGDALQSFGEVLGDETEAGKFVAAAGAIISTYSAVTKALDTPGLGLARIPYAVSVGAFGLAQVAQIYKTNTRGKNSTSGSTGTGATEYNPSFNVVGGSRIDQLNDTIRGELGKPARAYVTTKDIRSGQELERNIIGQGTVTG